MIRDNKQNTAANNLLEKAKKLINQSKQSAKSFNNAKLRLLHQAKSALEYGDHLNVTTFDNEDSMLGRSFTVDEVLPSTLVNNSTNKGIKSIVLTSAFLNNVTKYNTTTVHPSEAAILSSKQQTVDEVQYQGNQDDKDAAQMEIEKLEAQLASIKSKEDQLKRDKNNLAEQSKQEQKLLSTEIKHLSEQIQSLRKETDHIATKIKVDTKKFNDTLALLEPIKRACLVEYDEVTKKYNEEFKKTTIISEQLESKSVNLQKELDIVMASQTEMENEIASISKQLQRSTESMQSIEKEIQSLTIDDESTESQGLLAKANRLKYQEHEILCKLMQFKQKYPDSLRKAEKLEQVEHDLSAITMEKAQLLQERKQISETIENLRKKLHEEETDNEKIRADFLLRKEEQENNHSRVLYLSETSKRYLSSKNSEIHELKELHEKLELLHKNLQVDSLRKQTLTRQFCNSIAQLLANAKSSLDNQKANNAQEFTLLCDDLHKDFAKFIELDSGLGSLAFDKSLFDESKFFVWLKSATSGTSNSIFQIEKWKELNEQERRQLWESIFRNPDLPFPIDSIYSKKLVLSEQALLLQGIAEIVIFRKRRIYKVLENMKNMSMAEKLLQHVTDEVVTRLTQYSKDLELSESSSYHSRKQYLDILQQNIDIDKKSLFFIENTIDEQKSQVQTTEDFQKAIEEERHRLSMLAESVSRHEEQINVLHTKKAAIEDKLLLLQSSERNASQQLNDTVALSKELENEENSNRTDILKRLLSKLRELREILHKIQAKYLKSVNVQIKYDKMSALFASLLTYSTANSEFYVTLKEKNDKLNVIFSQRQIIQKALETLYSENQHIKSTSSTTFEALRSKKTELEAKLSRMQNDMDSCQTNYVSKIKPLQDASKNLTQKINSLSERYNQKQKEQSEKKSIFDKNENQLSQAIAQVRAKYQQVVHKLQLKQQQQSKGAYTSKSTLKTKTDQTTSSIQDKLSYVELFNKKKDNSKKEGVFDTELYEALMQESEDRVMKEIKQVEMKLKKKQNTELVVSHANQGFMHVFGPHAKPLEQKKAQEFIDALKCMLAGTPCIKKNSKSDRVLYVSPDFTRIEIKDPNKKIPESFVKLIHLIQVQHTYTQESDVLTLVLRDSKLELNMDTLYCKLWCEGLTLLLNNKQNLFYLKYNMKNLQLVSL